jgi:formylglycine-generating enzyme required for sulfatase activity
MPHPIHHIFDAPTELKRLSEMVFVEGGTFCMGCEGDDKEAFEREKPAHEVMLYSFCIGKYLVTQALWKTVMDGENPSLFIGDDLPVESVSWDDIQVFLTKLNKKTGKRYRLPTETEWEYAAKGGRYSKEFPFIYSGSNNLNEVGWSDGNSHEETKHVGLKSPNLLDIHDMSSNVQEWCSDWYSSYESRIESTTKNPSTGILDNPIGAVEGSYRVLRGGHWFAPAEVCRNSFRYYVTPSHRDFNIGFRLVYDFNSI